MDASLQLGALAIYRQRAFACICSRAARSFALAHGKLGVAACAEQRQRVVALARSSIYITTPAEHWQPVQRPFVCRLYGRCCHVGCETAVCSITSGYGLLICVCSLEQSTQCCVCCCTTDPAARGLRIRLAQMCTRSLLLAGSARCRSGSLQPRCCCSCWAAVSGQHALAMANVRSLASAYEQLMRRRMCRQHDGCGLLMLVSGSALA